ncbi:hypothetical protein J6590_006354 [Homalodisca vitripennis]|nr:hypothetical protein J6590_006354 [Homalodisca vitripennis]
MNAHNLYNLKILDHHAYHLTLPCAGIINVGVESNPVVLKGTKPPPWVVGEGGVGKRDPEPSAAAPSYTYMTRV